MCNILLCETSLEVRTKREEEKREGESCTQTSLIVAAHKKMLPIGLNMCTPGDQELISLAKIRYSLVSVFLVILIMLYWRSVTNL